MIKGIDISTWQGEVDFTKVKHAVDFVMVRASYGCGFKISNPEVYVDAQFRRNQKELRRLKIPHGYYHYSYPSLNTPQEEADFFLWTVGDLQPGEVLALDFEEPSTNTATWCLDFLNHIKARLNGYKPLLYINQKTLLKNDFNLVVKGDFGLWLALWTYSPDKIPSSVSPWPVLAMHQWSDKERVPGISGNVDANSFFGSVATFKKYGYQIPAIPVPTPLPEPEPTPLPPINEIIYEVEFIDEDRVITEQEYLLLDEAEEEYEEILERMKPSEQVHLYQVNKTQNTIITIKFYIKPVMETPTPVPTVTVETLSDRLQNSASYAIPVQLFASALGVIIHYHQPSMPVEVIFAYTTLAGILGNIGYAVARFVGSKITATKEKTVVTVV